MSVAASSKAEPPDTAGKGTNVLPLVVEYSQWPCELLVAVIAIPSSAP